jgi:hypothetical protein
LGKRFAPVEGGVRWQVPIADPCAGDVPRQKWGVLSRKGMVGVIDVAIGGEGVGQVALHPEDSSVAEYLLSLSVALRCSNC